MEHSPVTQPLKPAGFCCLKANPKLEVNEHAWTRATTMLYVEHPWGTGFSYGRPEPATEIEASGDLYAFIQNFFVVFPDLASRQLYIFGESYAGMFVPSILHFFHHENLKNDKPKINIAGGAIVSHFQSSITLLCRLSWYRQLSGSIVFPHSQSSRFTKPLTGQWMDGPRHSRTCDHRLLMVAWID